MEDFISDDLCPHYRARVVFDDADAALHDDASPLVVRLDDQGHTKVVSGFQGRFNAAPIGYAWKQFGDVRKVSLYLAMHYGARIEFVGVPGPRTFAFVVVAHPEFVATYGGEGEEDPDPKWVSQILAVCVKEVTAYAAGEAWQIVIEKRVTGKCVRFFDEAGRSDEAEDFEEWEETNGFGGYLDYDFAVDQAERALAGEVLDCKKRLVHGA